ncbi:MAG TPA: hypothetical protein VKH42_18605 [Vicinamibacterales bacterium]|nr:hypothetical protein [Vicinamibacterales bacterium]
MIVCLLAASILAQQPALGSRIWIGRYAEFEQFLRTAEIVDTKVTPIGVMAPKHVFFKPGGLAAGGALKAIEPGKYEGYWESYKSEIAAYKLDRLLELDMVPPTVEVRVGGPRGQPASLQLWIENTIMLEEMTAKHLEPPDAANWNRQLHRMYLFDDLIANIDENEGNLLFDREWNFVKIDHSRAFTTTLAQPFELGKVFVQIDQQLFDRVKRLDRGTVKRDIGDLLETGALDAFFRRRDAIVTALEKLAQQKGATNVFVP